MTRQRESCKITTDQRRAILPFCWYSVTHNSVDHETTRSYIFWFFKRNHIFPIVPTLGCLNHLYEMHYGSHDVCPAFPLLCFCFVKMLT